MIGSFRNVIRLCSLPQLAMGGALLLAITYLIFLLAKDAGAVAEEQNQAIETNLTLVSVIDSSAVTKQKTVALYGLTEAKRIIQIKPELSARVASISVQEGEWVEKGQLLMRLAQDQYPAQLAQAEARLKEKQLNYRVARELNNKGHESDTELARIYAEFKQAEYDRFLAKLSLDRTTITSPFTGVVDRLHVEEGDAVKLLDTELATLLDTSLYHVAVYVPEHVVGSLQVEDTAEIRLMNDQLYQGRIHYIGQQADQTTRSYRVEVVFDSDDPVPVGMTSYITLKTDQVLAHAVPRSALTLGEEGDIGVKLVNELGEVMFYPVAIIHDDQQGVWLSGLPNLARIIQYGHGFVRVGERVLVTKEPTG